MAPSSLPPDVNAVRRSQEYFRLKRPVQSNGDIYELDVSTLAVYIGPDSDIAEVQMTYFNPDEPLDIETAVVSVNGPFVGRVDSLPKTKISSTGQNARILLNPVDIIDNAYIPPDSIALRRFNVPAIIDVIASLKPLPEIPSVRADRTLRYSQVPYDGGANGTTELIIPIYGRRMVTVTVAAIVATTATLALVNLQPGIQSIPRFLGDVAIPGSLPPRTRVGAAVIRASDAARHGETYDIGLLQTGSYIESDQPGGLSESPQVRGMADLLVVTLATGFMGGTSFADVYVKLADRET